MGQPVPVRQAATVVLLRDEPDDSGRTQLQVFMVRRRDESGFVGGHHVFPGGVVDEADRHPGWSELVGGPADPFQVAAVRELLEESGVLLAVPVGEGRVEIEPDDLRGVARQVHSGETLLLDLCRSRQWRPDLAALRPWSHWVTPEGQPRRYDTRFYVAVAPRDQEAVHDGLELTEGLWASPAEFLRLHSDGAIQMILPTVASLRGLAGFTAAGEVLAAADDKGEIRPVTPEMRREADGSVTILVDGEAVWSEPARSGPPAGDRPRG